MINCIYHPFLEVRVVDNDTYEQMLNGGEWFATPREANEARLRHETSTGQDKCESGENFKSEAIGGRDEVECGTVKQRRVRKRDSKKAG